MPKSKLLEKPRQSDSADDLDEPCSTVEAIRAKADALFRTALECCRQHERFARVVRLSAVSSEQRAASDLCDRCNEMLGACVAAYEKCTAREHPDGDHEAWWHKANALWHASREYLRRHDGCDGSSRRLDKHTAAKLGELHMEYELEASALLALQQATEAYRKVRPEAW